jgi:hypothetical protein
MVDAANEYGANLCNYINQLNLSILSVFAVPDEGPSLVRKFAQYI